MKKQKMSKSNSGITLIALIITIIVLLILAGISISTIMGENGILSKSKNAKERTRVESIKEQIALFDSENEILKADGETTGEFAIIFRKVGIRLADHIIIAGSDAISLATTGKYTVLFR